ncbi:MAG: hypothetical protein KKA05_02815 [Alphaproteobacteria bacterium]|nr:hypothetical protein [Alphaproteobacteria bacterium]MBU0860005.1 hypothetical protein [Alphaproteobacteria bacterium]
MKSLYKSFLAAAAAPLLVLATAQAQPLPALTDAEQQALESFRRYGECVEQLRPLQLKATEAYEQQLELRDIYIGTRAEELARQRADAGMHIIIGGALSEGMTPEQADSFVDNLVERDTIAIRDELGRIIDKPQPPQNPADQCQTQLQVDIVTLNTYVRDLTDKYGPEILVQGPTSTAAPAP